MSRLWFLIPPKPSCICLFLLVCTVRRVLTEQGRSKIQYFTLFRTLSCLTSFTTVQETFFPLLTTTSLLLSLRHSKLLSSLFRQPLCLLICSLRFCSKKGLTKMPFKFFFSWSELLWSEDWPHFSRADFLDVQQLNVVEERLRRQRSEMRCNFL